MVLPEHPVTLKVEQIAALNDSLSEMRHGINNNLSVVCAAVQLIRSKPQRTEEMIVTAVEQVAKINQATQKFSAEFERAYGIRRD